MSSYLALVMQSQGGFSQVELQERIKQFCLMNWERLNDRQKFLARKIWGVITYKWRWQIAMNVPYLAIFILDRTIPAVHKFDMDLIAKATSYLPIPAFISSWFGFS